MYSSVSTITGSGDHFSVETLSVIMEYCAPSVMKCVLIIGRVEERESPMESRFQQICCNASASSTDLPGGFLLLSFPCIIGYKASVCVSSIHVPTTALSPNSLSVSWSGWRGRGSRDQTGQSFSCIEMR